MDLSSFLVALIPVLALIIMLGILKQPGDRSALLTLVITVVSALTFFKFSPENLVNSLVFGTLKALFPILFIIIMAIFSYNVLTYTKKMEVIKEQFSSISTDKTIQVLLITWGFGGLLEGMAGFGTAVAIPASILIGLGFPPIFAATVSLIANSVATGFGAVGTPVIVLAKETNLNVMAISADVILQLAVLMFLIPFIILHLTDPTKKAKNLTLTVLVGASSLIAQYLTAKYVGAETPAIIGSIVAIIVIIAYAKMSGQSGSSKFSFGEIAQAWSIYALILVFVLVTSPLLPEARKALQTVSSVIPVQILGSEKKVFIRWLTDAGTLLFLGTVIGGLIQGAKVSELATVLGKSVLQLKKTILTIICLISLSTVMDYSGMIGQLGIGLAAMTGSFYPFIAPTIGCLGTFLTGSDTSSNILFGKLQTAVAAEINVDPTWLAAANTAGATGGKIISPQSIAVATSACSQQGKEGEIMKKALPYALIYIAITGVAVYLYTYLSKGT